MRGSGKGWAVPDVLGIKADGVLALIDEWPAADESPAIVISRAFELSMIVLRTLRPQVSAKSVP